MTNLKRGPGRLDRQLLAKLAGIRELSLHRATHLREHATASSQSELLWMSLALQELDVAHEELRVVEEELHAQADELNAVYGEVETERRRYRDMFELAPEPYLVTDTTGLVLHANQRACELLNIHPQFVVGKPLASFVGEDDRQLMRNVFGLLVSNTETMIFDLRVRPRSCAHSVCTRASVRRDSDAAPAALRWILHEQRDSLAPQLERPDERCEQLEAALADERRARDAAERALARRNEQLAFVAHELRNPLNSATGWLTIMTGRDSGQASQQHGFDVLTRNLKTLASLVEELVDQTRVAEELIALEYTQTDMRTLLERVCDDARGLAQVKCQRFGYELPPNLGTLCCDGFRVQQALGNVIGNALKFTPAEGAVQLTARALGDALEIAVRDSGPGIAQEHLRSIFEPFTRVDPHGASSGLGLGLNIARKLIELHGGSITAESEGVGCGATFRVRLPLAGP